MSRLAFISIFTLSSVLPPKLALAGQAEANYPAADTVRLTLGQARTRASRANPDLLAARVDTSVARGQLRQARLIRFNPSVDLVARPTGDDLEAGLSQELEIFGQRGIRTAVGRSGLAGAEASVVNALRLVVGQVDRAYYRLASATQRTKLSDEVLALNERLAEVAGRQQREGEISRLDYNLALVELGRARARALASRREKESTAIELGRLVGLPRSTPVAVFLDSVPLLPIDTAHGVRRPDRAAAESLAILDVDVLTQHALRNRPDLEERSAALAQARAQVSLARREALPNPVVRGVVEQARNGSGRTLRPGIGLTLPFFNRNQGDRQAFREAARQAELEHVALVASIRSEIATALAAYRSAVAELQVLEATVIAAARQNRSLGEIAYREGKVGLPVLLLIQNQAIDAELEYWTAWQDAREALANLAEATAQNIEGLLGPETGARR